MTALDILSLLFATAALFGWLSARWLRLPITVGTMLLTVVISAGLMLVSGLVPGIHEYAAGLVRRIDLGSLILHGMLPLLLFAGAFLLDLEQLVREKIVVALLSVAGTTICFILVSALIAVMVNHRIPWMQCLIFGALISPTDPIAVLEMLRRAGVSKTVQAQLAGESLFNDGVAAVIFLALLEVARGGAPTPWQVSEMLVVKAGGGVLVGICVAWVTSQLMRRVNAYQVDILFTVAVALGGYTLAELLQLSAPLEAVVAGLALRRFNHGQPSENIAHDSIDGFWEVIDEIQNSVLFVLLGLETLAVSIDPATLRDGLAAIVTVNAVRLATVATILAFMRLVKRSHRSSTLVLTWGGLRGGLSIALALSVPAEMGRTWIVGVTYLVVLFSIVIQGGTMDWLLRKLSREADAN